MNYDDPTQWTKVPLSELLIPKSGRLCMGQRWWAVTRSLARPLGDTVGRFGEDRYVLFYKGRSPQCNAQREIVERIRPDCDAVYVEMAFVSHNCHDYV